MAQAHDDPMVTLRVASEAAGVSVSALRKWYRNDTIRSAMVEGPNGPQRLVALADVMERATKFQALEGAREITRAETRLPEEILEGRGLLIPRDDWAKMMTQLGNLLEITQRESEARERAAHATTKAEFLAERVGELRQRLAEVEADLARRQAETETKRSRFRRHA